MAFFGGEYHSLLGAAVPGEFIGIHPPPGQDLVAVLEAAELGHINATCGSSEVDTQDKNQKKLGSHGEAFHGAASWVLHSLLPNPSDSAGPSFMELSDP